MAITNTWSITKLDRMVADGYVFTAHFNVKAVDNTYNTILEDKVDLEKPDTLIPYSDLTENLVIGWVKNKLTSTTVNTIEALLADRIADQKAPTRESGVPW
jgi:hypothetical protein